MKPTVLKIALLFLVFNGTTHILSAQTKKEAPKQVHIDLTDGNSVDGKLIARRGDTVVVESAALGLLNLHIKNIKNIESISSENLKTGVYWFENRYATHTYFAPTGYNFRKGEGYYGNIFLFFNQVGYGFSNNFSISAGTELISLLAGDGSDRLPLFFYLNPKFSFQADKSITIGVGSFLITGVEIPITPIPYAVATLGNRNNNLSIGAGAAFSDGDSFPVLMFSGQARLTRGISLMSENYLADGSGIGTSGFRFMSKSIAFNLGLMYLIGNDDNPFSGNGNGAFIPVPFLGLNIPFGKTNN